MILMLSDRAEAVDYYDGIEIKSTKQSFRLPKVMRLFATYKLQKRVPLTRHNVFLRDHYVCQYCPSFLNLTLDHIIPRSKGGQTTWENLVTCCKICNHKKGSKNLKDLGWQLKKTPIEPRWSPKFIIQMKQGDPSEWSDWFPQLTT